MSGISMIENFSIERKLGVENAKCCHKCGEKTKVMKFISKVVVNRKFNTKTHRLCYDCYDKIVGEK